LSIEKPIMQKTTETIQPGNEEAHVTLIDDWKKTWICLGCNNSFLHHHEIVTHMHSENHIVIANSDFVPSNEIPQAEIRNMLSTFVA
jgi:hypothetical protein